MRALFGYGLAAALAAAAPTSASAQTAAPVGVSECDRFLQRYDACLSATLEAEHRAQARTSINQLRAAWRQAAQNPQSRAAVAQQCTLMAQQVAETLDDCKL